MSYRLCIDIGGTFTDLVVVDRKGHVNIYKSPTTPDNYADAFIDVLKQAAGSYKIPLERFMEECSTSAGGYFAHGSTVSTNAIIEGKVAKTGLICTHGFRDVLTGREGGKEEPYNWQMEYPLPYIPRYLTVPVTERVNSEGEIERPLDEKEVRDAIKKLKGFKVNAIAVALLWSIANNAHELRIGELIEEVWPGIPYSLSHQVNPCIREYRRTSSTAIDASLKPLISSYVAMLQKRLAEIGYKGELSLFTSSGGVVSVDELVKRPVYSVDCGPALAPSAGRLIAGHEFGVDNIITTDMGGTSFDVACITNGELAVTRESLVDTHMLGINKIDSKSIGAGGGSIAWVDSGGLLHVGPKSAGAMPGPACYGKGGTEPTVTDANVSLGYLDPGFFLGGKMKLDAGLAAEAINKSVAKPLKLSVDEASYAIWGAVNVEMCNLIQDITIWKGIDPREYMIVSGGGAAGLHIGAIASDLGVKKVLIPRVAGVLSAYGGAFAEITSEFSASKFTESGTFDYEGIGEILENLEKQAADFLQRMGVPKKLRKIKFYTDARYPNQVWDIPIPLRSNRISGQNQLERLVNDFHNTHEKVFTVKAPEEPVEFIYWRAVAIGKPTRVAMPELPADSKSADGAVKGKRKAYFRELGGRVDTAVYDGSKLKPGKKIPAPAIIEEPTTTVLIMPGSKASITKYGNYLIEIGQSSGKTRTDKK
ncbi:MAG: hydantoinase/oxoprolinase family protein [Deltaproteobacteria bacterium]|nr:hydantoinase/oxoprolinase family protein [Deltaproteobacteria bacterium]